MYFFFPTIWISVLRKPKHKHQRAGYLISKIGEAPKWGLEVYLFKLVIELVKQCVLCDHWEVIHLATYSAWKIFLILLNDQWRNTLVMPLLQLAINHWCRIKRKLRRANENDKSTRIIKKPGNQNLSRMT